MNNLFFTHQVDKQQKRLKGMEMRLEINNNEMLSSAGKLLNGLAAVLTALAASLVRKTKDPLEEGLLGFSETELETYKKERKEIYGLSLRAERKEIEARIAEADAKIRLAQHRGLPHHQNYNKKGPQSRSRTESGGTVSKLENDKKAGNEGKMGEEKFNGIKGLDKVALQNQ